MKINITRKTTKIIYIHLQYTPNVFISFSHANPESLDLSKPACIYFILKMSLQNYKRQLWLNGHLFGIIVLKNLPFCNDFPRFTWSCQITEIISPCGQDLCVTNRPLSAPPSSRQYIPGNLVMLFNLDPPNVGYIHG